MKGHMGFEEGYNKKGKKEGLETSWFENGQKRSEINYKNGEMEGIWNLWYENGQKLSEQKWKNGKLID